MILRTSDRLNDAMENCVISTFIALANAFPGAVVTRTPSFTRFHTGIGHPMANIVLSSDFPEESAVQEVAELLSILRSEGAPSLWFVNPSSKPANLGEILESLGADRGFDAPGMAADLEGLPLDVEPGPGVQVITAESDEDVFAWAKLCCDTFGIPAGVYPFIGGALSGEAPNGGPPMLRYVALLDGKPVATSCVTFFNGVAGIFCVATDPSVRGRGIGSAVTLAPMRDAKALGYRYAILQSSDLGYSVYEKLGFRELCRFQRFLVRPE